MANEPTSSPQTIPRVPENCQCRTRPKVFNADRASKLSVPSVPKVFNAERAQKVSMPSVPEDFQCRACRKFSMPSVR